MFQGGGNVNLLGALHHPVKNHVNQDIGSWSSDSITAVDDHRTRSAAVAPVYFPLQKKNENLNFSKNIVNNLLPKIVFVSYHMEEMLLLM